MDLKYPLQHQIHRRSFTSMLEPAFRSRLLEAYEAMPRQLRAAAQWVLDNPRDVALLSMREQAKRAGVTPASMTRLAQRMGFDGYEGLRALYAERLRRGETEFSGKAEALVARRRQDGDGALGLFAHGKKRHVARVVEHPLRRRAKLTRHGVIGFQQARAEGSLQHGDELTPAIFTLQ
jgi:hypothetical protein